MSGHVIQSWYLIDRQAEESPTGSRFLLIAFSPPFEKLVLRANIIG